MNATVIAFTGTVSEETQRKLDEVLKQVEAEVGEENFEKIGFPRPRPQR